MVVDNLTNNQCNSNSQDSTFMHQICFIKIEENMKHLEKVKV